jgi:hypothetical protein
VISARFYRADHLPFSIVDLIFRNPKFPFRVSESHPHYLVTAIYIDDLSGSGRRSIARQKDAGRA